ncbi:MAG: DUF1003 domain-containing protein [Candidatus Aenigmarchaeota archaeon]|nr:DUF1003 domain-containing protein [Candidatus Aenigmarchaeota archaeon]
MDKQKKPAEKPNFSRIDKILEKDAHLIHKRKLTLGQKASDDLTRFCGSWSFIIFLSIFITLWISLNITAYFGRWDKWPFIILNLILSCLATIQAPIILMSQNREEERAKIKRERDYLINRKAEREVENIQKDLYEIKKLIKNLKK